MKQEQEHIVCPHTQKLLARRDATGMWLYCKLCRTEHHYTWQQLKQEVNQAQTAR